MHNYSNIQKFLHDLILSNKFINKSLFEIEKLLYLKKTDITNEKHVFITGLPRSGTTSILNFIYASGDYASLTYKNLPFVFSPSFSKIFSNNNAIKKERLHKDGLYYDLNSPEAFDEIFFRNSQEFIKNEIANYIQLILNAENKNKYLSKNNLNYKRINLINSIFPNSIFLIPIREPLQHAHSLLNQHSHFCKFQKEDSFVKRYMNYLGHNEFGIDHQSWYKPIKYSNFNSLNYWLEQWYLFYQNILNNFKLNENCFFLIYEKLCDLSYMEDIEKKTNLNLNLSKNFYSNYFKNSNKTKINLNYSEEYYLLAKKLYLKF